MRSTASATSRRFSTTMENSGLRGLGGAGFPAGRKWRIVRGEAGAAADGGEHRRGRTGHVQGSLLPRARPAPLPRGHADRRLGGGHRRDLHLPARRVRRLPRAPDAGTGGAAGRCRRARIPADPPAPRRRRLHLRRRVGDDRIHRRQARHAAAAAALRRAGRPVRPSDARAQHGDAVLGARHPGEGRRLVRRAGPPRAQGPALASRCRAACRSPACTWRRPASRCAN